MRGLVIVLALAALAGCGEAPSGDGGSNGDQYVRAYTNACIGHGGVQDSSPMGHFQPAYVICQDQTGFYWKDQKLVEVK